MAIEVVAHAEEEHDEDLRPAWSLTRDAYDSIALDNPLPDRVDRDWALGGATGKGVKVCILDSGVESGHPSVGEVAGAVVMSVDEDGNGIAAEDSEGDLCGHGTACAGVIHSLAPEAELYSVRVLGAGFTGSGKVLLAGLKWAVEQGYDVINMSLSTTKRQLAEVLHELADTAYFKRTVLVAAAHNMPVESFPWRFSSVISVGSHEEDDPLTFSREPGPAGRVLRARSAVTGGPFRSLSSRPRPRRSSSSRAASTWTSPGSAARRSGRPGTASRHRASQASRRSCSPSTRV